MGAFDRALGRVSEAEREYRRTIGRSLHASIQSAWKIAAFCVKAWLTSVFPTVQWAALAWICLSSSLIAVQAAGALIAAFILTAAGSFWLTLLYEGGASTTPEHKAAEPTEAGFWQHLWLLIVPLRSVTKFMGLYYAIWLGGSVLLSYAYHRYLTQLPQNPLIDLNEQWWQFATDNLPTQLVELRDWIVNEMRRL